MNKNITLNMDAAILKKAKLKAVEQDKSLSQFVKELIQKDVQEDKEAKKARKTALAYMKKGFKLGGPIPREELYDRK